MHILHRCYDVNKGHLQLPHLFCGYHISSAVTTSFMRLPHPILAVTTSRDDFKTQIPHQFGEHKIASTVANTHRRALCEHFMETLHPTASFNTEISV